MDASNGVRFTSVPDLCLLLILLGFQIPLIIIVNIIIFIVVVVIIISFTCDVCVSLLYGEIIFNIH